MSNWNEIGFAPQGWQCPVCKRVYSPTTPMCYYCGNNVVTTTTTNIETPKTEEDFTEKWKKAIQGTSDYETYLNHNVVDSVHAEINSGIIEDMEPRQKFCD